VNEEGNDYEALYDYSFVLWIDEPRFDGLPVRALCECLKMGMSRCQMEFTESQFNIFREQIGTCGFSLREIERTPHVKPEVVK